MEWSIDNTLCYYPLNPLYDEDLEFAIEIIIIILTNHIPTEWGAFYEVNARNLIRGILYRLMTIVLCL